MKKTAMVMVMVMVMMVFTFTTGCSANTEPKITDVYSETREILREKCISALEDDGVPVGNKKIKASHFRGRIYLYFQDYTIEGQFNSLLYEALCVDDEYTQTKAVELLSRLDFDLDGDTIFYEQNNMISDDFNDKKSKIEDIDSEFKKNFKADLVEFIESEENVGVYNSFIKVTNTPQYWIRLTVIGNDEYGIEFSKEYHVYFHELYGEEERVAEALINGDEIELPNYEYELEHGCYINVSLNH